MDVQHIAIEIQGLTRRFGETLAVDHLDLNILAGEIFGLLGHNGAGKTTTVRLLNGVLTPTAGHVRVLGLDPITQGTILRRQTGVLTETAAVDERLTGREILTCFANLYRLPKNMIERRIADLLDEFGLAEYADDLAGTYSKGMRQRLLLARTLLHSPRILFLDEPTTGLDPAGRRVVHELILQQSHHDDRTVVLCTHDLVEAQRLCDRVAVLERGRIVAVGSPAPLAKRLQQGVCLRIELSEITSAIQKAVEDFNDTQEVDWDRTHCVLSLRVPVREMIPPLLTALVEAGAQIFSVVPQEPTLEDVYFALHTEIRPHASIGDEQ